MKVKRNSKGFRLHIHIENEKDFSRILEVISRYLPDIRFNGDIAIIVEKEHIGITFDRQLLHTQNIEFLLKTQDSDRLVCQQINDLKNEGFVLRHSRGYLGNQILIAPYNVAQSRDILRNILITLKKQSNVAFRNLLKGPKEEKQRYELNFPLLITYLETNITQDLAVSGIYLRPRGSRP